MTSQSSSYASNSLKNVKLTVYAGSSCAKSYASLAKDWSLQVCAGSSSGSGSCYGDDGGPLFVASTINGQNKYVLSGITAYFQSCTLSSYPGLVYICIFI